MLAFMSGSCFGQIFMDKLQTQHSKVHHENADTH